MAAVPKLDRVLETALYVDDLDRAAEFYEQVLELTALTQDSRFRAYDVGGTNVLLLFLRGATLETVQMPGGTIPPHDGHGPLHVAFAPSERTTWRHGSCGSANAALRSKAGPTGHAGAAASIFGIRTVTCWNWRLRGSGRSIEEPGLERIQSAGLHRPDFIVILGV